MRKLTDGDKKFIKERLMSGAGISKLRIVYNSSKKKWPDIWVEYGEVPIITVTDEWRSQNMHERRKRLVHEAVGHLAFSWSHNEFMDKVGFSTYPSKDIMSSRIYRDLLKGQVKSPEQYIREVLNER